MEAEGVELVRFRATTRLNHNALNYLPVDGVVGILPDGPATLSLSGKTLPSVNISHARRRPAVPSVINDDLAIGKLAADFLARQQVGHLACVVTPSPWLHLERAIGFRKAVREKGGHCHTLLLKDPPAPKQGDYTGYFENIHAQIAGFCRNLPLPCAVFCANDNLASQLMDTALELDLRIPADLRILGCDNERGSQSDAVMPISTVEVAGRRIGWLAGEALVRLLRGKEIPAVTRVAPEYVVERATTGTGDFTPFIRQAVAIFQREAHTPLRIQAVAERLGVSRRKLEMAFQQQVGQSPYDYLVTQRLDRACQLLSQSNLRIGEIAEATGFGDMRTLGTYFRRRIGMSPRKWRKVHYRSIYTPRSRV